MIPADVIRNIRRIQIKSSHIVDDLLVGRWHSAFKGRGMEFEEVRPYQVGDDVRSIDWNVTARAGEPFIKLFREEREMSVVLLVDISRSQDFGSVHQTKRQLVTELAATLAFSAIKNNDKVGLTMFSDMIEQSLPPRQGSRHVLRIIRELLYTDPVGTRTDITAALEHLGRTSRRRRVVFLISDFQDQGYEQALKVMRRKHDIIPVLVRDKRESELPAMGLVALRSPETGQIVEVDTTSRQCRARFHAMMIDKQKRTDQMLSRLRLEPIRLETGGDMIEPLTRYFDRRQAKA
ncbi:VWA domain containing CoxE-like protein [Rubripirellula amarantea]|uniref:VWA domain containing CoxE-like protein n=1 Tax=Rubripirellula amarantea TaxID=2527999 RepID=A0A5C5WDZ0_9BACT|nr:DUF58 domain-containing protein [Rubripirellula amarantea]TWT49098.1 VWA domain containing CoxE-like protein [Rubripirellula amarantea]